MELWIRSQDRDGLYKAHEVYIDERDYGNDVFAYYIRTEGVLLGTYKAKERALEVLDEIENILKPQEYEIPTTRNTFISSTKISNYVYEMPKE